MLQTGYDTIRSSDIMGYSIFAAQADIFILGADDDRPASAAVELAAPDTPYSRLEQRQTQRQLIGVVERLPAPERRVVLTHYFQLHTFEEVALDMGLTNGRVSQLHHAALRRMREWGSAKELPQPG